MSITNIGLRLRQVNSEADLREMARESAGDYGSGVLSFRIVGAGCGRDLFLAAWSGDALAQSLVDACRDFIADVVAAPPGAAACLTCGGPFSVPADLPWAVLVVYADIPEPSLVCCSGLCTPCCTWKDVATLQREIMQVYQTVFPGWGVLSISAEAGHA
jgi:hypothetical protein